MDPLDYYLELHLESFALIDPARIPPQVISLKLVCLIKKETYSHCLKTILPATYAQLTPNPRIRRFHLDGFNNGFPEAFINVLPRLFPNLTHIVIEKTRIAVWPPLPTKEVWNTYNPHQGFVDLLYFYVTRRAGVRPLQILSLRDVDADPFYADAAEICKTVPSIEVISTSGLRNVVGRVVEYPAVHIAPFVHPDLLALTFGLRSDGTAAPAAPITWPVPELYRALTDLIYDKLQLLDLTMVAFQTQFLANIVQSTPNVLMVKLSVMMPVCPPTPSALTKKAADDLIEALKGWKSLEEIELLVPLSEELQRAVDRAKKEDKERTYLTVLPKREKLQELSHTCRRLRCAEASVGRQTFLGYICWKR
ncbi:hypothetical protein CALVIDRAFT_527435 [Calocera viscosa TUFC12733]|uniref:Uncharacterized protein n=1 Tax=Calocera viscosa (strain TUFC12733) TaxID=1330018 RepID=A0A167M523_CALVF|nr:hypothetical protein CALVIDRAFT_527435 [Calocera viscosa TUFC12733]